MEFSDPLIGTRKQNYKYFYATGLASLVSLVILFVISGYTAYVATHLGHLMTNSNIVLGDIQELVPEVRKALTLLQNMCKHANFTKNYGHMCS